MAHFLTATDLVSRVRLQKMADSVSANPAMPTAAPPAPPMDMDLSAPTAPGVATNAPTTPAAPSQNEAVKALEKALKDVIDGDLDNAQGTDRPAPSPTPAHAAPTAQPHAPAALAPQLAKQR